MNREQMIAHLAEAGRKKEVLNELSDCDLKALCGSVANGGQSTEPAGDGWDQAREWRSKYENLEAQTQNARASEESERARLLDDVLYAQNRAFSDEEVKGMDFPTLRKLHQTMFPRSADYSARGGPRAINTGNGPSLDFVRPILSGGRGDSILDRQEAN